MTAELHNDNEDTCGVARMSSGEGERGPERRRKRRKERRQKSNERRDKGQIKKRNAPCTGSHTVVELTSGIVNQAGMGIGKGYAKEIPRSIYKFHPIFDNLGRI